MTRTLPSRIRPPPGIGTKQQPQQPPQNNLAASQNQPHQYHHQHHPLQQQKQTPLHPPPYYNHSSKMTNGVLSNEMLQQKQQQPPPPPGRNHYQMQYHHYTSSSSTASSSKYHLLQQQPPQPPPRPYSNSSSNVFSSKTLPMPPTSVPSVPSYHNRERGNSPFYNANSSSATSMTSGNNLRLHQPLNVNVMSSSSKLASVVQQPTNNYNASSNQPHGGLIPAQTLPTSSSSSSCASSCSPPSNSITGYPGAQPKEAGAVATSVKLRRTPNPNEPPPAGTSGSTGLRIQNATSNTSKRNAVYMAAVDPGGCNPALAASKRSQSPINCAATSARGDSPARSKPPLPPPNANADLNNPGGAGGSTLPRPPPRSRPKSWTSTLFNAMRNNHRSVTFQCVMEENQISGSLNGSNQNLVVQQEHQIIVAADPTMPMAAASSTDGQKFYSLPRPPTPPTSNSNPEQPLKSARSRTPSPFRAMIKGLVKGIAKYLILLPLTKSSKGYP